MWAPVPLSTVDTGFVFVVGSERVSHNSPLGRQTHGIGVGGVYLHIGDHQVPGELGPAVNEAVPVQQVHSAEG